MQHDKLEVFFWIDDQCYVAGFAPGWPRKNSLFVSLCTCVHICGGDFS